MAEQTPTKRYIVTSRVTINPAGEDEPPIVLELTEERGKIGLENGYLEEAPTLTTQARKAAARKAADADKEDETKAVTSKAASKKND